MVHDGRKRHRPDMFPVRVRLLADREKVTAEENAGYAIDSEEGERERAGARGFGGWIVERSGASGDLLAGKEFQRIWIWGRFGLDKHSAAFWWYLAW